MQRNSIPILMLFVVLAITFSVPAQAGGTVTQLRLKFPEVGSVPLGTTSEVVTFTGTIHLKATAPMSPQDPFRFNTTMEDVTGVGQTSGTAYKVTGSADVSQVFPVPGTAVFRLAYRLHPSDPLIPPNPIRLDYSVPIDAQGKLIPDQIVVAVHRRALF